MVRVGSVLAAALVLGIPFAAAAERTLPVTVFPGVSSGSTDPRYQALIVEGASSSLPSAPRAQSLPGPLQGLLAWFRPSLSFDASATGRFVMGPLALPGRDGTPGSAGTTPGDDLSVDHDDVGCVVAESYPRLRACITPRERVGRAQVFFRPEGVEPWYAVDMEPDGACFAGVLPKPKASLPGFEYYIAAVDTDFEQTFLPAVAPDTTFAARVVRSEGDCDKGKRVAAAVLKAGTPVVLESLSTVRVPAGFSEEGLAPSFPGVAVSLVATGASSGDVLQLQATNTSGSAVRIAVPPGLVMVPARGTEAVAAKAKGRVSTTPVRGFCLDFAKAPPAPGTLYRLADSALAGRFGGLSRIPQAATRLARVGGLHPDSEPSAYADSIRQWALWTRLAGWGTVEFTEAFVGRTRKNVEEMKRPWTPQMEAAIRAAAPGRWGDIGRVLDAADARAGRRPGS